MYQKHVPGVLLVSYLLYTPFITINLAHSVILFSLAGLFGFTQYLQHSQHSSKSHEEFAKLKSDLELQIKSNKENYEIRLKKTEDEVTKIALSASRNPSSLSTARVDKKVIF